MSLKLASPGGMGDGREELISVLIADVFDEEQHKDVIFVLARVHAPAKFVAARPEGGV